jgi:hypothetical protein
MGRISPVIRSEWRNRILDNVTNVIHTVVTITGLLEDRDREVGIEGETNEMIEGTTGDLVTGTIGKVIERGSGRGPAAVSTVNRKAISPKTVPNPDRSSIGTPGNP